MKKNTGFTIIELMVAIAIVAILSAVAVPNMIAWRNNMQFNSAARMVKSAIEATRMNAIRSNMPARLDFIDGGHTFDSVKWDPIANTFAAPETFTLPPGAILSESNFAGDQLQFTSRGMPRNAIGGRLTLRNDAGNLCLDVVIASIGSTRIVDCP